jgi:hypothetical protein
MIKKITKKITKRTSKKTSGAIKSSGRSKKISLKDLSNEQLHAMIAQKAYELFEQHGYSHGNDQSDWYEAEKMVRKSLKK